MARPSKIDRLPPEIRDAIGELRRDGRTIDEILAHLRQLGVEDISRSGLGEHLKKWGALADRLKGSREAAEAIMARFENQGADDRMARLNIQLLQSGIMALQVGEDGEPVGLEPKEAMFLTQAVKNLVSAAKVDQSRYIELKAMLEAERERAERLQKANDELSKVGRAAGVSPETLAEINRRLGVV